ncbi:MAG TPA: NAD(P)H-quinone oxidoreductase [Stellaceae bacterium]|jgi:NADPH2:quinone reductase|nr:NAD(P)H-quinone oxidoreductase [Stellaceae bacterium]
MTTLPATMTVIEIASPGGPEALRVASRPMPVPGPGEVLVAVAAAGVNRPDIMQRKGQYPPPPGASDIPGLEIAGTVAAIGLGVHHWKVGDEVCALVTGGGYASHCVAPVPQCLPVPKGFSMVEAAALPETFFTVWHNVFERGKLRAGESILIHGGSSGIGTVAIQLARAFGASAIFATAGSREKCHACEQLGATRAIDYKHEDFVQVIREATGNRGVDLVLDMIGGDYIQKNLSVLAVEGRHVSIATQHGVVAEVNFVAIMGKRLTLTGSGLRPRSIADKGAMAAALRREVWPLLDAGTVKPVIHRTFPLAEAGEAHRLLESSAHIGKIVLSV